jgi:ABC-type multidrug transport system permease subunit
MSVGLANTNVTCANIEYLHFDPPAGKNCTGYLEPYMSLNGGYLTPETASATSDCSFCRIADTNAFLASVSSHYDDRWRNFGILWAFVIFNIVGAVFMYWLLRVPKNVKKIKKE